MQLSPQQADIDFWVKTFLPPKDVYYLDGTYRPLPASTYEVLTVPELLSHPQYAGLDYVNAYEYWRIDKTQLAQVLVADPEWFSGLPMQERAQLFKLQIALGRGLIFDHDVLRGKGFQKMIQHAGVDGRLVINHLLWERMDLNIRQQTAQRVARSWEDDWEVEECPDHAPAYIAELANTWLHHEGANCFGLALYCLTADADWLVKWVQVADFLERLQGLKYFPEASPQPTKGDVLLFKDSSGELRHAAYVLEEGLVLNKSGQVKYQPLRLITFEKLLKESPEHSLLVYRQGVAPV